VYTPVGSVVASACAAPVSRTLTPFSTSPETWPAMWWLGAPTKSTAATSAPSSVTAASTGLK
jgi:hypothetical protein